MNGKAGNVYNVISDRYVMINAYFVYLTEAKCPEINGIRQTFCWTHPGTYFGMLSIVSVDGDRLLVSAGDWSNGFSNITFNDQQVMIGDKFGKIVGDSGNHHHRNPTHPQGGETIPDDDHAARSSMYISRPSSHYMEVNIGLYELVIENSDQFVNLLSVSVSCWACLMDDVRPQGLLGRTWDKNTQHDASDETVSKYQEKDNNIFGCNTDMDKFCHKQQ